MTSRGFIVEITFASGRHGMLRSTKDIGDITCTNGRAARFPDIEAAKRAAAAVRTYFPGSRAEVVHLCH